ncbi:MAG TPA: hypothetical protein VFI31_26150 [Pirellulales bacterium]|nr:hypothetical protein [Pirellulales bacterium]
MNRVARRLKEQLLGGVVLAIVLFLTVAAGAQLERTLYLAPVFAFVLVAFQWLTRWRALAAGPRQAGGIGQTAVRKDNIVRRA